MRYLIALFVLSGCAQEGNWIRAGSSQEDFYADKGECGAKAFAVTNPAQQESIFAACMQGKRWYWQTK